MLLIVHQVKALLFYSFYLIKTYYVSLLKVLRQRFYGINIR